MRRGLMSDGSEGPSLRERVEYVTTLRIRLKKNLPLFSFKCLDLVAETHSHAMPCHIIGFGFIHQKTRVREEPGHCIHAKNKFVGRIIPFLVLDF